MESILTCVKRVVGGIAEDDTVYDKELIVHINGALAILNQLGVGPRQGFLIKGKDETWTDFIGSDKDLEMVKLVVSNRVQLSFDPPANSFLVNALEEQIKELEWRIEWNTSGKEQ